MFHHVCEEYGKEDAYGVQADHDKRLVSCEECRHEEKIDGKTGAAAHERNHQHCQSAVPPVLNLLCRHYRRHIAAEAYEHRDERTAVKADEVHYLVHEKGGPGHVSGVFQQGQEEEENHDVGQECEHGADSLDDSVRQHAREPSGAQQTAAPGAEGIDPRLDPPLGIGSEGECALEYGQKYQYHQREAEPPAGQDGIYLHGKAVVRAVSAVNDGLLQCSCHETSPGLGYQDFRLLPELPFQPVVGLLRHSQHFFGIGQGIHVRHNVVLMLKQSYGNIPLREMEPLVVPLVDGG